MNTIDDFHGVWKLVSWITEEIETRKRLELVGDGYVGFLTGGRLFVVLTAKHRRALKSGMVQTNDVNLLTAYTGRYRIEGDRIITIVDVSDDPSKVGTELVRYFKCVGGNKLETVTAPFASSKPDQTPPVKLYRSYVVWEREM